MTRLVLCAFVIAGLTGCAARPDRVTTPNPNPMLQSGYVDLQPGWRLRVITPLTKSGSYKANVGPEQTLNGTVTLTLKDDFVGYETAFYDVQARGRSGVRIAFLTAEENKDGVTTTAARPRAQLFQLSPKAKYVRLVYLTRASRTDHDMAIVAATKKELLAEITVSVQADPQTCRDQEGIFCSWIPAGIAVRPEMRKADSWTPAR